MRFRHIEWDSSTGCVDTLGDVEWDGESGGGVERDGGGGALERGGGGGVGVRGGLRVGRVRRVRRRVQDVDVVVPYVRRVVQVLLRLVYTEEPLRCHS